MFVAPDLGVVVSVAAPGVDATVVAHRLELARAVGGRARFVRPLAGVVQPVVTDHGVVSVWEYVPTVPLVDFEAVGADIARFHAIDASVLGAGPAPLPPARVMRDTAGWIDSLAHAGRLRPADVRTLSTVDVRLNAALGRPDLDATGLIHGDLFWSNVLVTRDGAVLCDTDELGRGTPEHDVAFLFDPDRRTDREQDLRAFASGYGSTVPDTTTRRLLVRRHHLTFTLRLAEAAATIRTRFWLDQWMGGWRRVAADDDAPLIPPREHGRLYQLRVAVRSSIERRAVGGRPTA